MIPDSGPRLGRVLATLSCAVCLVGCRTIPEAPLDESAILVRLEARRANPTEEAPLEAGPFAAPDTPRAETLDLGRALGWMEAQGPRLVAARADALVALARAEVPTPREDPSVGLGLLHAFGAEAATPNLVPFGAFEWPFVLDDRRELEDLRAAAAAHAARIDVAATAREAWLDLEASWIALSAHDEIVRARTAERRAAEDNLAVAHRLAGGGGANAHDVALLALEEARARHEEDLARAARRGERTRLAALLGVSPDALPPLAPLEFALEDEAPPSVKETGPTLLAHHPRLGRLRAAFAEAEAALRTEIARGRPEFVLGSSIEREHSEKTGLLGLELGVRLPLFDGNRVAIAEAHARREAIRTRFQAALQELLGAVASARERLRTAEETRARLEDEVLPAARRARDLARRLVEAGDGSALAWARAETAVRALRGDLATARSGVSAARAALARAFGRPLTAGHVQPVLSDPASLVPGATR